MNKFTYFCIWNPIHLLAHALNWLNFENMILKALVNDFDWIYNSLEPIFLVRISFAD